MPWFAPLLIAYALAGLLYWLSMLIGSVRTVRSVPRLADGEPPEPAAWPSLSVVVAACDEADTIEAASATLRAQDYPDLQIILVDDRSQDGTGRKVDAIAAADPRIRAVHVRQLPEGWLGKVHALDRGVREATGQWILFTDADVHFAPGAFRKAVAWAEHRHRDHLAVAPELRLCGWLLNAMVSSFLRFLCVSVRAWEVEDLDSPACVGVGAFNLVRREAFAKTPGFRWLRMEVADDLGLGLMIKRWGGRPALASGVGLASVQWYRSFSDAAQGAEKGFASLGGCSTTRMLLLGLTVPALELAPVALLLPWGVPWLWIAGAMLMPLWLASDALLLRWSRRPVWPVLLAPLAQLAAAALMLRTTWLGMRRGGIAWRGTVYASPRLREGKRVWLSDLVRRRNAPVADPPPTDYCASKESEHDVR